MGLLNLYSYMIANWLNGGNFSRRSKMTASDIVPEYNQIYTKSTVKKVIKVIGLKPDNVDMCFVDYIRDAVFAQHPNVETIIHIQNYPVRVDVRNEKFTRAMGKASERYASYKEMCDAQSGIDRITGKTYRVPGGGKIRISRERLDDLYQMFLSYYYIYSYVSNGGTTTLTNIFIELCGSSPKEVNAAKDTLFGVLSVYNVGCEEVRGVMKTYLNEFGPAKPVPAKLHRKFLPQMLFTDENMAAFTSYKSRGLVGEPGLLLGQDFRSRLPFSINIFKAASAQVFLLMGKTGSGKTYAAFQYALSALAIGQYVTAIDIKGREWSRITPFMPAKILTFDERHPSFVNTLRLDDVMGFDGMTSSELYNTAVKGTVNLLMLIVNLQPGEGNPNDLEMVLREAVLKLYTMQGVDPANTESFVYTKGMKYSDVLPILEDLGTTNSYTDAQRRMVNLARTRCHAYLGESGIFSDAFQNEISLNDVLNSPFVIYEFNKNSGAMTDSLDVLRIFMVQFLDSKKKAMLRERNKFLFCFYEELQRCDQFGNLLEYICADVTGSRSNNAVIVLLMNSLKVLSGERARDIRSNITSFLVGNVEETDIQAIEEDFGQPWLASQLQIFHDRQREYRNCFAASVDTGADILQTIYKVEIPKYLSDKFRTRTTIEDIENAQAADTTFGN